MGFGQLSERVAIPGARPCQQVGRHHLSPLRPCVTSSPFLSTSSVDASRAQNWAPNACPLSRCRRIYIYDGSELISKEDV
jgi:hypothetical protein